MKEFETLIKDIETGNFSPIYFLEGEESYYMDKITDSLEKHVLREEEKEFNQSIVYGQETTLENILSLAKQFPMGADKQLVIVKEAQNISFDSKNNFEAYIENPQNTTILAFAYKYKNIDKRKSFAKLLSKKKYLFTSSKLYDSQLPEWIGKLCKFSGLIINEKGKSLLAEFLGNDLSRIENEINKLKLILGDKKEITAELIEKNIGISKDYNNFELRKAIINRNYIQAYIIADYFGKNQKTNPITLTISTLYTLFSNLIIVHSLEDKSKTNIAKELKINPFFVNEFFEGIKNYPLKKCTRIISILRIGDQQSKGINVSSQTKSKDILIEILYKIFHL